MNILYCIAKKELCCAEMISQMADDIKGEAGTQVKVLYYDGDLCVSLAMFPFKDLRQSE